MKRFIIKSFIFFTLVLTIICIGMVIPPRVESFHYSIHDKHQSLSQNSLKQRLILVGGSSLSFGIYSPLIEERFNIKVVNTAISGGYGLKFIIDDIKPYIREGDVVIIAPEYENFYNNDLYGGLALTRVLDAFPSGVKTLNFYQVFAVLQNLPKHALQKIIYYPKMLVVKNDGNIYMRESLNSNGDFVGHWDQSRENIPAISMKKSSYNTKTLDYILDFSNFVKEKKGEFYYTFPALSKSSYDVKKEAIQHVFNELQNTDMTILGTPSRYSFNDTLHFDTHYHLHKEGQFKRTEYLINDLENIDLF